ncbi:hypothetical protein PENSPDRAFT_652450 [Peniophora sp. CONT]|nr:hypothetical protein PENSPDRAFT_652450 [Peniophora sp. CONT]
MDVDSAPAHSPSVESNTTPVLLSRIDIGSASATGSSSEASAPASISNASSQAGVIEPVPGPSLLNPIVARPVSAEAPDLSTLSSASPSPSKGKTKATVDDSGGSAAITSPSQPSPSARATSSGSQSSALPGNSTASTPSSSNRDPALTLEKFLSKRSDSLGVAHTKLSTNMTLWVEHEGRTMASGTTLYEHLKELRAEADVSVAQATRAREEAERAEELAIRQRERAQQALSQLEGLQQEHTRGRDLAAEAQQYSEKLQKWDATAKEKEQRFVGALRNHRQTEETARARQADEVARHEVARAEAEAARAKEEVAHALEREELAAARVDLEASRKNEVALRREVASLQRKLKAVVETIAGLAGTSEDEGEAQATVKEPASVPALDRPPSLSPNAAHGSASIGVPQVSSSASLKETRFESSPHTTHTTPPASATADSTPGMDAEATPSRKSTSNSPSRSAVSGFVPAQTEAGRVVDTERPLASTSLASEPHSPPGHEVFVKKEPEAGVTMSPAAPPRHAPNTAVTTKDIMRPAPEKLAKSSPLAFYVAVTPPTAAASARSVSVRGSKPLRSPSPMGPAFHEDVRMPLNPAPRAEKHDNASTIPSTAPASRKEWGARDPAYGSGLWPSSSGSFWGGATPPRVVDEWNGDSTEASAWDGSRSTPAGRGAGSVPSRGSWAPNPAPLGDWGWGTGATASWKAYEPPRDWLLEPGFTEKRKGLRVRIQYTRGDEYGYTEWSGGEHEGKEARVLDVTADGWSGATATVLVEKACQLEVPVGYLRPIMPRKANGRVLVLDGERKGTVGTPRDRGGGMWLVQFNHTLDEVANECLCIWEDPETDFDPYCEAYAYRITKRADHNAVGVIPAGTNSSTRSRRQSESEVLPQAGHYQLESISSSTPSVPAKRVFQEEGQEQQEWEARRARVGANAGYSPSASLPAKSPTAAGGSPIKRTRVRIDQTRHLSGSSSATQDMHDPNSRPLTLETARKRKETNQDTAESIGRSSRTPLSNQPSTSAHVRRTTSGDRRVEDPSLLARIDVAKPNAHVPSAVGDLSQEHRLPPTTTPRKASRPESSQHPNVSRDPLLRTADEGKTRRQSENPSPSRGGATGRGGSARGGKNAGARGRGGTAAVGAGRGSRGRGRGRGGHQSTSDADGPSLLKRMDA